MLVSKPEDMFEPKLPPINLWAMAPAYIFYANRGRLMKESKYLIYGTSGCNYCTMAKELARVLELDYEYIDIYEDTSAYDMIKALKLETIPQIFKDDHLVPGGYVGLEASLKV